MTWVVNECWVYVSVDINWGFFFKVCNEIECLGLIIGLEDLRLAFQLSSLCLVPVYTSLPFIKFLLLLYWMLDWVWLILDYLIVLKLGLLMLVLGVRGLVKIVGFFISYFWLTVLFVIKLSRVVWGKLYSINSLGGSIELPNELMLPMLILTLRLLRSLLVLISIYWL